ncbi:MAG TPA: SDR family oxidoreductase [Bacteroidota bacterium]|nr:SDR family oxidoreductase [Bacteroidota bacterium]
MSFSRSSAGNRKLRRRAPRSRVVWITGSGAGIGKALAEVFAENGDSVVATGRNLNGLRELRSQLSRMGLGCDIATCNVLDAKSIDRTAGWILRRYGRVDLLINNAGVSSFATFLKTPTSAFDNIIGTNLRGYFLAARAVLPAMLRRREGMIVSIISYAAKTTYAGSAAYSASKAGADAMMNVLRTEVRGKGIRVMNIYPGAVDTAMWPRRTRTSQRKRMLNAAEVADMICLATNMRRDAVVEELVIRPQSGDMMI